MLKKSILFMLAGFGAFAAAQTQTNIFGADQSLFRGPASTDKPPEYGWLTSLNLSGNLSLSSSQDVVGQTNGSSQTYGTNIKGTLYHLTPDHEWRNDLFIREATNKTPNVPRFVKSDDEVKLSSIFLYFLPHNPKIGPYARAEVSAPLFKGEDVQTDPKNYRKLHLDGTSETFSGTSTRLTDPFKPLTTKEAIGFFNRPVFNEKFHLELRVGFAAQQISAAGQYAVKGDNKTNGTYDINELKDVSQAGLEAGVALKGKIDEKSSYELGIDSLTPFINDKPAGDDRNAWRLTNVDAFAKLTSKVTDWMSFGYDYKLKIQPQLVDRAQQIHMLVINFTYPTIGAKL